MKKLLIIILCVSALTVSAVNLKKETAKSKGDYNFWFSEPERADSDTVAKPLVVFLHGASLCGRNMDKVRRYGTIDAIARGRKIDAYVIAPQNPGGSWKPQKVMRLVDWTVEHHNVDTTRIYVLGMSLGGYGALDFAATYPERIAAAIAICGGATVTDLSGLNNIPLWIIHGTADRAVSIRESDKVAEAMRQANPDTPRLHYDRVAGMNHGQPARMFYLPETYDWLMQHSLSDSLRPVAPTFEVNNIMLRTAYRDLKMPARKRRRR